MIIAIRIFLAAVGFVLSFVAVAAIALLFTRLTYHCTPGPLEPCDGGPLSAFGLIFFLGVPSAVVGALVVWLMSKRWFRSVGA